MNKKRVFYLLTFLAGFTTLDAGNNRHDSRQTDQDIDGAADGRHLSKDGGDEIPIERPNQPPVDRPDQDQGAGDFADNTFFSIGHIFPLL